MDNEENWYIDDGSYGTEKQFPPQIQKRIDAGMGCGSSIGKGWLSLIVDLDEKLSKIHPDYKIDQVKEKFGGLRFYTNEINNDDSFELINEAERKSYTICDICGEPGTPTKGKWIATRCEKHK